MGTVGAGRTAHVPLMRPLTPSSVGLSLHQMEHQLLEAEVQLENYTSGLLANFEMMRCQPVATAPSSSPDRVTQGGNGGEKGLKLNVRDFRDKAPCNGYLKDGDDVAYGDMERLSTSEELERRPDSGHGSRPSTRGSR